MSSRVHRSTLKNKRRWRSPYGAQANPQRLSLCDIPYIIAIPVVLYIVIMTVRLANG